MDRGAWYAAVHGVTKSRTWLSDFTFTFHFYTLEKEMVAHSSVPAWRIPGTGEPGGLPSMGSHRVRHDWSDLAAAANERAITKRKTPYFLIGMNQDPTYILGLKLTNTYSCLKLRDQRKENFKVHVDKKTKMYLEWKWSGDTSDSGIYWAFNKYIFNG